jgi:DNA repair exonuclease SbcCD nuclease subunit
MKAVVIGDCHFYNAYPSFDYLQHQFDTIRKIIHGELPTHVIFLGDIFHFRKPDPESIVRCVAFFTEIASTHFRKSIICIRGNHDTAAKSDTNNLCIIDILGGSYSVCGAEIVSSYKKIQFTDQIDFHLIAHFDSEQTIRQYLDSIPKDNKTKFVFGHFGFKGCLNPNGDEDSPLGLEVFKYPTFLGHIHKPQDNGHVHVVGTPYSTAFSEADNQHRYAVIHGDGRYEFKSINSGIRYCQFPLASLEANKDFIKDKNYKTILRVYLSQILDTNSVDLRKKIMAEYGVSYVDIKYFPIIDDEVQKSSYRPKSMVFELSDDLIVNYLNECKADIPKEILLKGLNKLKTEDDSKNS